MVMIGKGKLVGLGQQRISAEIRLTVHKQFKFSYLIQGDNEGLPVNALDRYSVYDLSRSRVIKTKLTGKYKLCKILPVYIPNLSIMYPNCIFVCFGLLYGL